MSKPKVTRDIVAETSEKGVKARSSFLKQRFKDKYEEPKVEKVSKKKSGKR